MADPTNKFARSLKQISSKRTKTDADYEEMARIEFIAGLYMSSTGPVIPQNMIDAVTVAGAKKSKNGQVAKAGCFALGHAKLEYDGPRTVEGLWADERFHFSAIVKIGTARIARMRPRFMEWSAIIKLMIDDEQVNPERVEEWLRVAGVQCGLGDWRPQNGRFTVERVVDEQA